MGFVCAIFLFFLGMTTRDLVKQYRSQSFPKVEGTILSATITTHHGSKGSVSYSPDFGYGYSVNGVDYEGQRYRYGSANASYQWANATVQSHPKGSTVDVYYNPNNPADALLSTAVVARDIMPLFMCVGFMGLFLFILGKGLTDYLLAGAIAGGVKIISDRMTLRVRLPRYPAVQLCGIVMGVLSFIAGFVLLAFREGSAITIALDEVAIIATAGAAVYFWQHHRIASGAQDLVIDEGARTIELPLTYKRRSREPLPFSSVTAVTLEQIAHRGRSGVTYTYAPTLQMQDGSMQRLTDLSQKRAAAFAGWLREKLGVKAEVLETE